MSTHNIGQWYKGKNIKIKLNRKKIENLFFKNLQQIGYRYFKIQKRSEKDWKVIKSFQSHYLPKNVTGKIDQKTFKISLFLAQ